MQSGSVITPRIFTSYLQTSLNRVPNQNCQDLTPEEKQSELKRYKDILLATLDYHIERSKGINYGEYDPAAHFKQLKQQTEENYLKGRLTKLKQSLRYMTEEQREIGDLSFGNYIKEKTGYEIDIFDSFRKRIDKIIERKRIKTENEYRDVMAMVDNLCHQSPVDKDKIDLLNNLLVDFDDKIGGTNTPKSKHGAYKDEKHFFVHLSQTHSPDGKRFLSLTESGTDESYCSTQVVISFENSGAGVYAAKGRNLGIKTYWKDNNTVIIETKKDFIALQRWEHVQSFQNIVKVEYIET
jgi:hypothetical protein